MAAWLAEILDSFELAWVAVLGVVSVVVCAFIGSTLLVGFLLVRLPVDYFSNSHPRDLWGRSHPARRWTGVILKNLLGVLVIMVGVVLSLPGVPGPGILTILFGLMLLNFPGKRRLERWLLNRPRVLSSVNRLRRRYGRPPLVVEHRMSPPVTRRGPGGNAFADAPRERGPFGGYS